MKKWIPFIIITAFFVFQGSSPWEGAATVAPAGELPANGRFIATNSFPRNTVVDITNIETNRTVRVIVANTLDSPGLLAIISEEAAQIIGLRQGSIGRIRMVQPSEPVAFMRFFEGSQAVNNGFDFDNIINEEQFFEEIPQNDIRPSDTIVQTTTERPSTGSLPYIVNELEWMRTDWLGFIEPVITQEPVVEESVLVAEDEPVVEESVLVAEDEPVVEESVLVAEDEPVVEESVLVAQPPTQVTEPVPGINLDIRSTDEHRTPSITTILEPFISGITTTGSAPVITTPSPTFSARTISRLDPGQFYVELINFLSASQVENFLSGHQIDPRYNPVVLIDRDNLYRILIGPLNQGESAAILRRFQSIGFNNAFVRRGG